jgi:pyruvate dehydrogenase E1 component beta subunit
MLLSATKASGPVVIIEPLNGWSQRGEVDLSPTPLNGAKQLRDGDDIVIITWGAGVSKAIGVAETAESEGLQVGVIDLRNLSDVDLSVAGEAITATGTALVLHDDQAFADGLVAKFTNYSFLSLEAPIGTHPAWRSQASIIDAIGSILNF